MPAVTMTNKDEVWIALYRVAQRNDTRRSRARPSVVPSGNEELTRTRDIIFNINILLLQDGERVTSPAFTPSGRCDPSSEFPRKPYSIFVFLRVHEPSKAWRQRKLYARERPSSSQVSRRT
jgi:hypothetical protein